jgi:hypothetical protein
MAKYSAAENTLKYLQRYDKVIKAYYKSKHKGYRI